MGTSLTGTKPKDTYDSLIKVGDNGPISGTAKYLSDGLGNDLPIAVSTSNVGIGLSDPNVKLDVLNTMRVQASGQGIFYLSNGVVQHQIVIEANPNNKLAFKWNGTERMALTDNGLTFNGDTAAANALDDYEEGTWTMGISFSGGTTGITYTATTGTYTKIGRQVTVNGYVLLSNKGTSTGAARLTGLPFLIGVADANLAAASLYFENISFANQFMGFAISGTTVCALYETTEAGAYTVLNDTNFSNNSAIIISLTYFV